MLIYKDSLTILKICNNKITTLSQIEKLKEMSKLIKLDLSGNTICDIEDYRKKVFDTLEGLQCLDGKDQDNQSVESDDDEEDPYGDEEGEFDQLGEGIEFPPEIVSKAPPDIQEKYRNGDMSQVEFQNFLLENNLWPGFDLEEEGELEMDEEEGEAQVDEPDGDGCKEGGDCC